MKSASHGGRLAEVQTLQRQRLAFSGDIEQVLDRIVSRLGLGPVQSVEPINVGFQDFNIKLVTSSGPFFLKFFSKERDDANVQRYVQVMEAALAAGVGHPQLLSSEQPNPIRDDPSGLRLVVMDFINGQTFYEMQRPPTRPELQLIAREAVRVNKMNFRPEQVFDPWAVPNIEWMYDQTRPFMPSDAQALAQEALCRFRTVRNVGLPSCFVHGDVIKTNTIVDTSGKIFILDFAVSNIYPRIQELAVIAANLLHDGRTSLAARIEATVEAYRAAGGDLSPSEMSSLYDYTVGAVAMEMMGGYYEKYVSKSSSAEVDYWINLGTQGLVAALKENR